MNWVYQKSEPGLWTVGFYSPKGNWHADSDHDSPEKAGDRVRFLNGGTSITPAPDIDPEQTLNNLTKLLNEDDEKEYLERTMAIVNEWRKKQQSAPDIPATNALVDLLKDIEKYLQGNKSGATFEESDLVGRIKDALAGISGKSRPVNDALVEAVENIKAALVSNAAPTDVIYALEQTLKEKGEESVTISPTLLIPLLEALAAHEKAVT